MYSKKEIIQEKKTFCFTDIKSDIVDALARVLKALKWNYY